jgi:hypothetical protein
MDSTRTVFLCITIVLFYNNFGKTNPKLFTMSPRGNNTIFFHNNFKKMLQAQADTLLSRPLLYSEHYIFIHTLYWSRSFIHTISSFINYLIPYSIDYLIPYFINHLAITLRAYSTICRLFNLSPYDHPTGVIPSSSTTAP